MRSCSSRWSRPAFAVRRGDVAARGRRRGRRAASDEDASNARARSQRHDRTEHTPVRSPCRSVARSDQQSPRGTSTAHDRVTIRRPTWDATMPTWGAHDRCYRDDGPRRTRRADMERSATGVDMTSARSGTSPMPTRRRPRDRHRASTPPTRDATMPTSPWRGPSFSDVTSAWSPTMPRGRMPTTRGELDRTSFAFETVRGPRAEIGGPDAGQNGARHVVDMTMPT